MRKTLAVVFPFGLALGASTAIAADRPGLGKPVIEADLALWDISIGPDGAALPPGSGTPAQGAVVYAQKCELCHGKEGQGGKMQPNQGCCTGASGRIDRAAPLAGTAPACYMF
jgi:cytochrome c